MPSDPVTHQARMFESSLPVVSIVGLPNVGKSTLFNRIVGRRRAIVHKTPGVTRDRNMAETDWDGRRFSVVDTGGLLAPDSGELGRGVERQVHRAVGESDLVIFLVDGSRPVSPSEHDIAKMLRRGGAHVLLVANKVERPEDYAGYHDYSSLGLGEVFPVSAMRGINCGDLLDRVVSSLPPIAEQSIDLPAAIRIAVVGRPNAGKSSLINYVLGEERLVVHPEAGTTRDAIDTRFEYHGRNVVLIDTAGLRRRTRIREDLEYYSNVRVIQSIDHADVVVVLVDSVEGMVRQDLHILSQIEKMGRGMVIALSKWDLVEGDRRRYRDALFEEVPYLSHVPVVFTSSVTGAGIWELLDAALKTGDSFRERARTPALNRYLGEAVARRTPPSSGSKPVRLFYISQLKESPPEFVIITSSSRGVKREYRRYLENYLRERLGWGGVPIRIRFQERKRRKMVRE